MQSEWQKTPTTTTLRNRSEEGCYSSGLNNFLDEKNLLVDLFHQEISKSPSLLNAHFLRSPQAVYVTVMSVQSKAWRKAN